GDASQDGSLPSRAGECGTEAEREDRQPGDQVARAGRETPVGIAVTAVAEHEGARHECRDERFGAEAPPPEEPEARCGCGEDGRSDEQAPVADEDEPDAVRG